MNDIISSFFDCSCYCSRTVIFFSQHISIPVFLFSLFFKFFSALLTLFAISSILCPETDISHKIELFRLQNSHPFLVNLFLCSCSSICFPVTGVSMSSFEGENVLLMDLDQVFMPKCCCLRLWFPLSLLNFL